MLISVPTVVTCLIGAARALRRERAARRRLFLLLGTHCGAVRPVRPAGLVGRVRAWPGRGDWSRGWAASLGAAVTGFILLGGVPGCAAGLAAAYAVWRWQRRRGSRCQRVPWRHQDAREPGRLHQRGGLGWGPGRWSGVPSDSADRLVGAGAERQLPLAADLLAACLAAGAAPREAAEAVGGSLGGPVGERLMRVAAELRLGGEPGRAWAGLAAVPGAYGLARCLERAGTTGVPAVEPVSRVAADCRAEQTRAAVARGRRAGVLATAPLGLCFLPAFLSVGVAPVVIGLADGLLQGN
ncbi:type II secretion system F family protein [Streptomyces sp. H27-D2]|nr:type II secretion system F family protein [Streptomyces sp. H27-D2]MEC4015002.1 type II secretion system F family protein [Streptomyces sp. H27-D2]